MGKLATTGNSRTRKRVADLAAPVIAGLWAWYDASDAGSITASSGAVSQWNDLSGNGRHVTQSTAGAKPTTGTRTLGGLNVLDFDGGDHLNLSTISFATGAWTMFIVCGSDTTTLNMGFCSLYTAGANDYDTNNAFAVEASNNSFQMAQTQNSAGAQFAGSGATPIGTWSVRKGTASNECDIKAPSGSSSSTATNASSGTATGGIIIGSRYTTSPSNGLDGPIAEIRLYSARLSDTDRDTIRTALISKWGA